MLTTNPVSVVLSPWSDSVSIMLSASTPGPEGGARAFSSAAERACRVAPFRAALRSPKLAVQSWPSDRPASHWLRCHCGR
jgi:hypothetical protein